MNSDINGAIESVRNDANRNAMAQLSATHHAEVTGLRSSYDTLRAIDDSKYATERAVTNDGAMTRNLITQNAIADRDRMIIIAENRAAEALAETRHTRHTNDIIINNNNNNNVMAQQLTAQQQQQQLNALTASQGAMCHGLSQITSQLANITNVSVNAGTSARPGNS